MNWYYKLLGWFISFVIIDRIDEKDFEYRQKSLLAWYIFGFFLVILGVAFNIIIFSIIGFCMLMYPVIVMVLFNQ